MAKPPTFEVIHRDERPDLYDLLDSLVEEFHADELSHARIQLVWRRGWKGDHDGRMKLGQASIPKREDRLTHGLDLRIHLNYEVWTSVDFSQEQQRALLDHELQHFAPQLDKDGEQKEGKDGLKEWRIRKHNLEEFREIVARHGQWKSDIQDFVRTAMEAGIPEQLTLADRPFTENVTLESASRNVILTRDDLKPH